MYLCQHLDADDNHLGFYALKKLYADYTINDDEERMKILTKEVDLHK